jgi:hypothetical protein
MMLRCDPKAAQKGRQLGSIGQQAAGTALSDPPAIGGIVAVDGTRDVPGLKGRPTAILCRADINDENRGDSEMV